MNPNGLQATTLSSDGFAREKEVTLERYDNSNTEPAQVMDEVLSRFHDRVDSWMTTESASNPLSGDKFSYHMRLFREQALAAFDDLASTNVYLSNPSTRGYHRQRLLRSINAVLQHHFTTFTSRLRAQCTSCLCADIKQALRQRHDVEESSADALEKWRLKYRKEVEKACILPQEWEWDDRLLPQSHDYAVYRSAPGRVDDRERRAGSHVSVINQKAWAAPVAIGAAVIFTIMAC